MRGRFQYYNKIKNFKEQHDYIFLLNNCTRSKEDGFEEDAQWLMDHYALDSKERLIDILKRTVVFYSDSEKYYERAVPLNFKYSPNIHEALREIKDSDYIIELFNNEEHNWMSLFQETYRHIKRKGRFFLNKSELKETVLEYISFLEKNRNFIIKTGFPETKFKKNEWFDFFFTNTLPVKLPVNLYGERIQYQHFSDVEKERVETDTNGNYIYKYRWIKGDSLEWQRRYAYQLIKPVVDGELQFKSDDGLFGLVNKEPLCSYEEAGYIPSLVTKEIECADALRESIYEWKLEILNNLLEYLYEEKSHENFSSECFDKLAKKISSDVLEYLFALEEKYNKNKVGNYLAHFYKTYFDQPHSEDYFPQILDGGYIEGEYTNMHYTWNLNGGIQALLGLVGFFQKELTIGTYMSIKSNLKELLLGVDSIESYYKAITNGDKNYIEETLKDFLDKMGEEKSYWEYYKRKVKSTIESDFKQEVTLKMQLKGKYIQSFYPVLESIAGTIEHEINEHGNMQSVLGKKEKTKNEKEKLYKKDLFRKSGEGFEIMFNGKPSFFLKETVGLNYIYILMSNRNKAIPLQELVYFNKVSGNDRKSVDMYDGSINTEGSGTSKEYSKEDLKHVAQKLNELIEEKTEANELGNYEKAEELLYKTERLQEYIRDAQNKKQDPELERMRTKVKNAITTAIQKVRMYDSELAQHFVEKINTGYTCMYSLSPSENTEWHFS